MANVIGSVGFADPNQALEGKHLTVGGIQSGIVELTTLITTPGLKRTDSDANISMTLHQAAREGNVEHVRRLLDQMSTQQVKKKINQRDEEMCTPLHYAARYHHLSVVKVLVERGANVNQRGEEGVTPLHSAAHYLKNVKRRKGEKAKPEAQPETKTDEEDENEEAKLIETVDGNAVSAAPPVANGDVLMEASDRETYIMVEYLVSKGAQVNIEDEYGLTPLHYAARRGNIPTARALLACKRIDIEHKDKQEQTPLHAACTYDHFNIVKALIEKNADLNAVDEELCTPLHLACMTGNMKIVTALFEAGEKKDGWVTISQMLSHQNMDQSTPLHTAVENKHLEVAKLCIEKGSDINTHNSNWNTPLHLAAESGDVRIAELLVANHASIDAVNQKLMTPLHLAAEYDQADVCTFLIEKGALLDRRDEEDFTPLLLAAVYGHDSVMNTLLEHGADPSCADKKEKTAIFWAAAEDKLGALEILLKHPDVEAEGLINQCDLYDNSPLHVAAEKGFVRIVKSLLDHNALRNSKNEEEETPIHLACKYGRTNVVRVLVEHDANCIREEDQDSNTPLHVAALFGHAKVAAVLIDAGADPEDRNCTLWTPLDCAAARGWVKTARVLLEQDSPVDPMDKTKTTPLLLASGKGHTDVVELLLQWNASVSHTDTNGNNCLDVAIDNNHKDVALAIINSDKWAPALRNETIDLSTKMRNTPMRKLIRKMPDVAEKVFFKCTTANNLNPEHPKYCITFNYEFLDDMYQNWKDHLTSSSSDTSSTDGNAFDEDNKLKESAQPYTKDSNVMKKNHPLMIMVTSKREDLLAHPLVTSLLRHKWNNYGRYFYYTNLALYLVFLAILTTYVVLAPFPGTFYTLTNITMTSSCEAIRAAAIASTDPRIPALVSPWYESIFKYAIIALCLVQLLRELFQIYQAKLNYLGWENLIEWVMYGFSIYLVLDLNDCQKETNLRDEVQWQIGAIAIFLAWIDLVLFIRKVPRFGIYVVMFTDVLYTFVQFSFVFFLFIVAFALSFHVLMANQVAFNTVGASLIKTSVMMIGEFEFENTFNDRFLDPTNPGVQLYFAAANYFIFVVFLIVMSIILMNLLVGLAVDDIKAVQDQAVLKRLAMQVELALDVESFVPAIVRRRFAIRTQAMKPNKKMNAIKRYINIEGQLSAAEIGSALNPENDELEDIQERQERLENMMKKMRGQMKEMGSNVNKIINMMETMLKHDKVEFADQDDQEHDLT